MSTPLRVAAFAMALAVAFLVARGVGAAVGPAEPADPAAPAQHSDGGHDPDEPAAHDAHEAGPAAGASSEPGGLESTSEGYTLRVVSRPRAGIDRSLRFVIEGPDGAPVTAYDVVHGKPLHLVKIRRDGAGYQHVHPTLADDGTWTVRMTLAPGSTRLLADFTPTGGPALILGTDVQVPGDYEPIGRVPATRTWREGPYRVSLDGELVPGESSLLTATVTRRGEPVTDLQPYLGAFGHLVALREGDLAYLHVHPQASGRGPEIGFLAEVPSTGRYRAFLDFRHDGRVRTAGFTLQAAAGHSGGGGDHDH